MAESDQVQERDGWFVLDDGTRLFEKTWEPTSPPNAHLIFLHGFSDRSEVQYALFPTLARPPYNIAVHAIDQRGWGRSVQHSFQRGLTGPTSQVLSDVDAYVTFVAETKIKKDPVLGGCPPLFVMGHSMGGQVALHYLLTSDLGGRRRQTHQRHVDLAGIILEAPYVSLHPSSQPSSLLVLAGRVAAMISPNSQMKQHLESRFITHDEAVNREWENDELCHGYGTLEGLRDMLRRGADLVALTSLISRQHGRMEGGSSPKAFKSVITNKRQTAGSPDNKDKAKITAHAQNEIETASRNLGFDLASFASIPTLWTHGTDDHVTDFEGSRTLFESLRHYQQQSARARDVQKPDLGGGHATDSDRDRGGSSSTTVTATTTTTDTRRATEISSPSTATDVAVALTEFKAYDGAYHKIHAEPNGVGVGFARDVGDWILKVVAARRVGDDGIIDSNNNDKNQRSTETSETKTREELARNLKSKL